MSGLDARKLVRLGALVNHLSPLRLYPVAQPVKLLPTEKIRSPCGGAAHRGNSLPPGSWSIVHPDDEKGAGGPSEPPVSDAGKGASQGYPAETGSKAQTPSNKRRRRRARGKGRNKARIAAKAREAAPEAASATAAEAEPLQKGQATEATAGERTASRQRQRRPTTATNGAGGQRDPEGPLYGALDLGTNNCRLLIARRMREGFRVVDAYSRIVRLGEGLSARGALGDEAMSRSIEALKICADKMERRGVTRSRLIATEACRAASNGAEFITRVQAEAGLSLEVVSNEDEAKLAVAGCAPLLDRDCRSALVFDIGGGSTELIWVNMATGDQARDRSLRAKPRIEDWISLPCGVVTLAERYGGVHVSPELYERMVQEVSARVEPFVQRLRGAHDAVRNEFHLLGTSGTVTTIAGVHLGLKRYDRNRVDGVWITPNNVETVTQSLLSMTYDDRANHPCVGRERADLVLAGCAIFEAIARAWPAERLRVADRGLREGILLSLMEGDAARAGRRRRRRKGPRRDQNSGHQNAGGQSARTNDADGRPEGTV